MLYQIIFDGTLLRCINSKEAQISLCKIHKGIYGAYSGGPNLEKKLMTPANFLENVRSVSNMEILYMH